MTAAVGSVVDIGIDSRSPSARPLRRRRGVPVAAAARHADDAAHPSRSAALYQISTRENWENLPHCRPFDHTMFDAIDDYVAQKLPTSQLYQALVDGRVTEVHGVYPSHFAAAAEGLGYSAVEPIPFWPSSKTRRALNHIRPHYYKANDRHGEPVLIAAVTPGRDYVRHYAGLMRHHLFHFTSYAESAVNVIRYPAAERTLAVWTGLIDRFVTRGEIVVVGYVQELGDSLVKRTGATLIDQRENAYYLSRRMAIAGGLVINLLGVKFSFWGSIAATLCEALCILGVDEIIYAGKLGALSTPQDVYSRIFCPSRFVVMTHRRVRREVEAPPNGLLARFPELDSGCHISVPTVLEEDYLQRHAAGELAATSIDNEIAQMAGAIADHNRRAATPVRFAAVHFATDYIRKRSERHLRVPLNLSNNRIAVARDAKMAMLDRIGAAYLGPYLSGRTTA